MISTDTLSSWCSLSPATVPTDRKGNSSSSELLRSRIGSEGVMPSVDVIIPLVTAARMEGMGTPASTRARLAALRQAARRAPSRLKTCKDIVIELRG